MPQPAPEPDPHVHAGRFLLLLAAAQHHQPCRGSRYEPGGGSFSQKIESAKPTQLS